MTIRAVIFDIGGVLVDIDWRRFREDEQSQVQNTNPYPYEYEQLNTDLARFMAGLRPHYKTATICNGGSREAMNRKFRLGELVDLMVFDGEEGVAKPDARIYQLTFTRLDVQPDEVVFVDDKERNVVAAQQLGMHTVHFKNTAQAIAEVQTCLRI
jgi:putative hydrolase of the HAD superfamily